MNEPTPIPSEHDELVPLALLALELGITAEDLARKHRDQVVHDDLGLRCLPADVVRALLDERNTRAARNAELSASWRRRLRSMPRPRPRGVPIDGFDAVMLPAQAVAARDGRPEYEGDLGIPRPSDNPFLFQEGGAFISPKRRKK